MFVAGDVGNGKAFEDYLAQDRKLLKESAEILESVIEAVKNVNAKFIIVPGDLTKDGERSSHLLAANYLRQLKDSGKQVFVVPGNHDIHNGHSYRYIGDTKERVPNITAGEFAQMYGDFGFNEALQRDSASLSYPEEIFIPIFLTRRTYETDSHSGPDGSFQVFRIRHGMGGLLSPVPAGRTGSSSCPYR